MPTYYNSVVRYDTINGTFKYYTDLLNDIRGEYDRDIKEAPEFMNAMYIEDNLLLLASSRSNAIIEFNMETEKFVMHRVGNESNTYYRMEYDGYDYWLIPHDSKSIARWNRKPVIVWSITTIRKDLLVKKMHFSPLYAVVNTCLYFPKKRT